MSSEYRLLAHLSNPDHLYWSLEQILFDKLNMECGSIEIMRFDLQDLLPLQIGMISQPDQSISSTIPVFTIEKVIMNGTSEWDISDHIQSDEDVINYLEAALEYGDTTLFITLLGDIERAKYIFEIIEERRIDGTLNAKSITVEDSEFIVMLLRKINQLGIKFNIQVQGRYPSFLIMRQKN